MTTPSGCIELIHAHIVDDIPRLAARLDRDADAMLLTSQAAHSIEQLVDAQRAGTHARQRPLHAAGASRRCPASRPGGRRRSATVETDAGSIDVLVQVSDEMMPGVVSLPHGWGHGLPGTRLAVANAHPGVNSNLLNPVDVLDVPSNTHVVNGVPCRIRPRS